MPIALMVSIWQPKAYIADLLAMPDAADIDFDPKPLEGKLFGTADLS